MTTAGYPLLLTISDPADLRKLARHQLRPLADELRAYVLESVAKTGGHLSSNLGTVELTVALHYVFNTPFDRLVWDVGHQTYPHKILTGRRERMNSLRQLNGISGFPCAAKVHTMLSAQPIRAPPFRLLWAWPWLLAKKRKTVMPSQ